MDKVRKRAKKKKQLAYLDIPFDELTEDNYNVERHDVGKISDNVCPHCDSQYFNAEVSASGKYTRCCENGAYVTPKDPEPPKFFKELYDGENEYSAVTIFSLILHCFYPPPPTISSSFTKLTCKKNQII